MESLNIATIRFTDVESGDAGVAIVRLTDQVIGLSLSLEHDGDVEIFLGNSCKSSRCSIEHSYPTVCRVECKDGKR